MSGSRVYEFHQREIDDLKRAAIYTLAVCTNLKRLLEGIRDNQPHWAARAIREFLDPNNKCESYLADKVDHLIDPVGIPVKVPRRAKVHRGSDGIHFEKKFPLTCEMREEPLAHRAAWVVHDTFSKYLWSVWRRGNPTYIYTDDLGAATDELVGSRWQEIRDELQAFVDYDCDGLQQAVEAESKAAMERCRQSIVGDATATLKPDIGTGVSLGDVAFAIEGDDEAANSNQPIVPSACETELQNALKTHGIRVDVAESLSPEQKRNIIMAHWATCRGLTTAKARDKWEQNGWPPSLGSESKTKLANKVKAYIKRGKTKLDSLAPQKN